MAICMMKSLVSLSKLRLLTPQMDKNWSSSFRKFSSFDSSRHHFQFENVGFIGLGNMGSRMATNLIKAGYKVTVHDINYDAMRSFSNDGIPTKQTPSEVADVSDIVITMLPSPSHNVGFIGLGNMGSRMATNLIKAGYKVTVHDINYDAMRSFSNDGIPTKQTPSEVADVSDIVITMLPSPSHVLNVYTGPNGLLYGHLQKTKIFIDSSTVDPQTSRTLSVAVSNCMLRDNKGHWENPLMLDAPVSGGVLAAESGSLTFMVGGSEDAYLAAKPLFLSMGKHTIYCGGSGNGAAAKICNNLALAVSMLGVSEALVLGQRLGIQASTLTDIFNSSSARCWSSDSYNPVPGVMEDVPASRNYDGGFASKLMIFTRDARGSWSGSLRYLRFRMADVR